MDRKRAVLVVGCLFSQYPDLMVPLLSNQKQEESELFNIIWYHAPIHEVKYNCAFAKFNDFAGSVTKCGKLGYKITKHSTVTSKSVRTVTPNAWDMWQKHFRLYLSSLPTPKNAENLTFLMSTNYEKISDMLRKLWLRGKMKKYNTEHVTSLWLLPAAHLSSIRIARMLGPRTKCSQKLSQCLLSSDLQSVVSLVQNTWQTKSWIQNMTST